MKQRPPPASFRAVPVILVALAAILVSSACATLPRSTRSLAQSSTNVPKTLRAININTASRLELEKLPGIGSGIAERIVAHREQYGPFRRAEHLMMVRGISDQKFRELQALIVVE